MHFLIIHQQMQNFAIKLDTFQDTERAFPRQFHQESTGCESSIDNQTQLC